MPPTVFTALEKECENDFSEKQFEMISAVYLGIINSPELGQLPEDAKAKAAITVFAQLTDFFGGSAYYFSCLDGFLLKKKTESIKKEFNGRNHEQLARKYGITTMRVRQIINGCRVNAAHQK